MKHAAIIFFILTLSACTIGPNFNAETAPKEPLILRGNFAIDGQIEGTPVQLVVNPEGIGFPVLNPQTAKTLDLDNSIFAAQGVVGPVTFSGRTGVINYSIAGEAAKRRALWFELPIAPDFAGELGPDSVPHAIVRFELRAPTPGERIITLPFIRDNHRIGLMHKIGEREILVQFDPNRAKSIANASTAKIIGEAHGGELTGKAEPVLIGMGIKRPIRQLQLSAPLIIGPFSLDHIQARIADYGSVSGLPDANADPDEIVVTANSRKKPSNYAMVLGADALSACSSLTIDKVTETIIFSCQ